ncbi:MAG: histidine kinase [Psychrosphaera sp.]|nr:histidine kinase [Psychrosphaera sp.]
MIDRYLNKSDFALNDEIKTLVDQHVSELSQLCFTESVKPDHELFEYPVPELGEGGSCSLFNEVADEPFDLTSILGKPNPFTRSALQSLHNVVAYVVEKTKLNWFGIYQTIKGCEQSNKDQRLVKLAYDGAISRSEYPLNEQYAQISNNVQVGMTGQTKLINNVTEYVEQGGAYYTCDPKVKSEACLPIFDKQQNVIGIIDAEAFNTDFFDHRSLALLIASCVVISGLLGRLS